MSSAWSTGSTRAWRRLRAYVLDRDGQRCRFRPDGTPPASALDQGERCGDYADQVHHLDPLAAGNPKLAHPSRLIASCRRHNLAYGDGSRAIPRNVTTRPHNRWSW